MLMYIKRCHDKRYKIAVKGDLDTIKKETKQFSWLEGEVVLYGANHTEFMIKDTPENRMAIQHVSHVNGWLPRSKKLVIDLFGQLGIETKQHFYVLEENDAYDFS